MKEKEYDDRRAGLVGDAIFALFGLGVAIYSVCGLVSSIFG